MRLVEISIDESYSFRIIRKAVHMSMICHRFAIFYIFSSSLFGISEAEEYYQRLDQDLVPGLIGSDTLENCLRVLFNQLDEKRAVQFYFQPEILAKKRVRVTAGPQSIKNHLILLCSSVGAKFELSGYPPKLSILKVGNLLELKEDSLDRITKWKENIHLRQLLMNVGAVPSEEVLQFAKKQLVRSDLFRVSRNQQGIIPNEFYAIQVILKNENAINQLKAVFNGASAAGKLYIAIAFRMAEFPNLELEMELKTSRDFVGFFDSEAHLIQVKPVRWIFNHFVESDKLVTTIKNL